MAARNMFIEIYEYPYKFMTFARMLGRPHGGAPTGLCRNSQKINSFKNMIFDNRIDFFEQICYHFEKDLHKRKKNIDFC